MTEQKPTLNIELAEKVLSHIEHDPDSHYQGSWINDCGTTACIAGHAMLASGEFVRKLDVGILGDRYARLVHRDTGEYPEPVIEGARLLGLNGSQATSIFMEMEEDQAIAKLRRLVDQAKRRQHHTASTNHEGA